MSKKEEKVIGNFLVNSTGVILSVFVIISIIYFYKKCIIEEYSDIEKFKYFRDIPLNLEPELLQYFYYGRIVSNSYYIAILNLIKLGGYRLEKSVNKAGKEVQKLIYNKNNNIELKEYQKGIEKTVNFYLDKDENDNKSTDLETLRERLSKSVGSGYKKYKDSLESEKKSLVGESEKISKKQPIATLIITILIIAIIGIITNQVEIIVIAGVMAILSLIYSILFGGLGDNILKNVFLIIYASFFFVTLAFFTIDTGVGMLYIPYILSFIFLVYVLKMQKLSKKERQIVEYVKGLRKYIKDYSMLKDSEDLNYINLWEDYFIMAIALKLNNKIINYFYNYGKEQFNSNLGSSMLYTTSFRDFNSDIYNAFYSYKKAYDLEEISSSYSESSGDFSGGSSSGGGGGRWRWRKSFLKYS